ncbi:hypothetical protein GCM10010168_92360 [Actinoplanes ianthinogenes]|uniref:DUF1349 domain-containing protein n=1 Tax=Actinoplanes ianthinogenes TaxID=122358 RepID=A0ABM7LK27_9ACTN|nr:DUF1349 domain-containing protein [Actinoplanes ianthinogenes]BCJ39585.1 hypothetical protein Aiant_02420 [Actinoplanes ianthinogenes]GGR58954.1 hypothetical protein GCM10010168_92360 [Actinoplanes ianthinogenes]
MILRAEWIKFRTVPSWVAGVVTAALIVVALGLLAAAGTQMSCMNGTREVACPPPPTDAAGLAVRDKFTFTHRSLTGDGSLTAKVGDMAGTITYPPPNHDQIVAGVVPWAKAGLLVKDGTKPGSDYAAVMLTGEHGVRMQHDYTEDVAAPFDASAKVAWLRLTRSGDEITGYVSADGQTWQKISTVRLAGLPDTVQIGLFVTSPSGMTVDEQAQGGHAVAARFTQATAAFSQVSPAGGWTDTLVGYDEYRTDWEKGHPPGHTEANGVLTLAGSGDIAPETEEGMPISLMLTGVFAGLLPLIAVAAFCGTAEFRHGMIRTTLAAMPRPGRVSAAKAAVIGAVALAAGAVAVGVTMPVTLRLLQAKAVVILAMPWTTTLRIAVGTALLLSLAAVFAYGMGSLLRRAVPAIVIVTALLVAPPILAMASVLPGAAGTWLLRLTPGAGFAIQQAVTAYPQLAKPQTVLDGYYPLAPWAGLGVLALWALAAVAAATWRLRRNPA